VTPLLLRHPSVLLLLCSRVLSWARLGAALLCYCISFRCRNTRSVGRLQRLGVNSQWQRLNLNTACFLPHARERETDAPSRWCNTQTVSQCEDNDRGSCHACDAQLGLSVGWKGRQFCLCPPTTTRTKNSCVSGSAVENHRASSWDARALHRWPCAHRTPRHPCTLSFISRAPSRPCLRSEATER
jgi:hypothetical protein